MMQDPLDINKMEETPQADQPLENCSLLLRDKTGRILFSSKGKWLHPLFEVEHFLEDKNFLPQDLVLHDKIAGRAAAALIIRLGFKTCIIDLVSKPALDLFERYQIDCQFIKQVAKIDCRTEDIVDSSMDLESIYALISKRAGYFLGLRLEIKNLHSGYEGKAILKGLNLTLEAGEQVVICGDNGAGKSTLIKNIIGSQEIWEGEILLDGLSLNRQTSPTPLGYITQGQQKSRFPISVEEIVALGLLDQKLSKAEEKNRIEIALRRTDCFHLKNRDVNTLSGGESQRVALARCLCQKARLILLDEPSSYLDKAAKEDLAELLGQLVRSTRPSIILVSHDQDWLEKLGWKTRILKDGRLC